MIEKIELLYEQLRDIGALFLIYHRRDNVEQVKLLVPEIQEFVIWFLEGNEFGIEEVLYQELCGELVCVLKEILISLEQNDKVLLHDAITYGLMEYLQLFIGGETNVLL